MNNSKLALESISLKEEVKPQALLEEREAALVRIIEALGEVQRTQAWSTLKIEIFDELPKKLRKELLQEARSENPNTNKLSRISGELKWAEKFSDPSRLESSYRVELQGLRLQLYGK